MRSGIKILLLLILLLLPTGIFIFLYSFGSNKFDVAVMHPNGLKIPGCNNNSAPHQYPINDSLGLKGGDYYVVYLQNAPLTRDDLNELRRVSNNNPTIDFRIFLIDPEDELRLEDYRKKEWEVSLINKAVLEELNQCIFGNKDKLTLVLTDPQRHVRGYYNIKEKKELDRLEGEIKILNE